MTAAVMARTPVVIEGEAQLHVAVSRVWFHHDASGRLWQQRDGAVTGDVDRHFAFDLRLDQHPPELELPNSRFLFTRVLGLPIPPLPATSCDGRQVLFNEIPLAARKLYYSHHRDVFAVCVMFLILAAIHSAGAIGLALRRVLSWRVLYPIAQVSYSLYLVHEMFMLWLFPKTARLFGPILGAHGTMAFAAALAIAMSFAGAILLYLFVERPSMQARSLPRVREWADPQGLKVRGVKIPGLN